MSNGDNFTSDIIIETVHSISVDKTVSNPDASLNAVFYFPANLICITKTLTSQT